MELWFNQREKQERREFLFLIRQDRENSLKRECDTLKLNVPVHVRAPTPDASLLLGGRRRIPLDDFVLRVDGRAYGRPADAAPLGAYAALPPGGPIGAWGVAVATLFLLFWEALRVARCLTKRKRS